MHVLDDVPPVNDEFIGARSTQGGVQDRATLGDVDPVPAQHRVAPPGEVDLVREGHEGAATMSASSMRFLEVDMEIGAVQGQGVGPLRVGGERAPQVRTVCRVQPLEVGPS